MSALVQPTMRRAGRTAFPARLLAVLAAAILLAAGLIAFAVRPAPADAAACGSKHKKGVTVVVDLRKFHHGIKVGCSYTFVPRQPGFICRISSEPRRCNGAPASAYWSYWHAKPHGKWVYSALGAASYHPKSGWVEGWAFGNGKPPGISPP
jgi:hypothetical protein